MQYRVAIAGMTDGEVRQELYALAGRHTESLLDALTKGDPEPLPETGVGSTQPRFASERGVQLLQAGGFSRQNLQRAATPYPGTQFLASNGL